MTIVRNIQVKLDITKENHSTVDATFEEFQRVTEPVIDYGWSNDPDDIIILVLPPSDGSLRRCHGVLPSD